MALQGDLNSFALPDVLRLLAGTGKSGRLEVTGPDGSGEVVLQEGTITSGAVDRAPHATEPGDVVFEILRFSGGSFTFVDLDADGGADGVDVDEAIGHAEHLIQEWEDVETVVPGMDAWVSLVPEIDDDGLHVSNDHWRALVVIGGGGSVRDLADALSLTDLAACRQVKEMAEGGLLSVRASHAYSQPSVELDSFDEFEMDVANPMTELEDLVVEDRPVVMEDRDDALLPEPLPGEGVAYEGELIEGTVDRHTFDTDPTDDAGTEPELADTAAEVLQEDMGGVDETEPVAEPGLSTVADLDEVEEGAPFVEATSEVGELDGEISDWDPDQAGEPGPSDEVDPFTAALEAANAQGGEAEPHEDDERVAAQVPLDGEALSQR